MQREKFKHKEICWVFTKQTFSWNSKRVLSQYVLVLASDRAAFVVCVYVCMFIYLFLFVTECFKFATISHLHCI